MARGPSLGKPREGEHADLIRDVVPRARRTLGLNRLPKGRAHVADAARHEAQLLQPHLLQRRRGQDLVHDGCPVLRGARVGLVSKKSESF